MALKSVYLAAAFAVAMAGGATAQDRPVLRIGYTVVPIQLAPIIYRIEDDVLVHHGKTYDVEFTGFRGSAPQMAALAAGEIDIAALAFSSFAFAIVNAGQDIRAIADIAQDGPQFSTIYAVREGSGIDKVSDLAGKTVAVNGIGGGVDMAARAVMLEAGLKPDLDVTIVEAGFGAMEAMLREEKADVVSMIAPFWAGAKARGGMKQLFRQDDGMGPSQFLLYGARTDFIEKNRDVLVDFLEDYIRGVRWYLDPANRDAALQIIADFTKRPTNAFAAWALTKEGDYFRDPSAAINVTALQSNIDDMHLLGVLREKFDVTQYLDLSLAEAAAARIEAAR